MKKLFGALLAVIIMIGFITPVFAVEGAGTSSTDVEYVVEGSFTWSVPAKISVSTGLGSPGTMQVTAFNLESNKEVSIQLTNSTNFDNGFYVKKSGDNTGYPYSLTAFTNNINGNGTSITSLNTEVLRVGSSNYSTTTKLIVAGFGDGDEPTTAGTYTDTLTFQASVVDAD